MNVTFMSWRKHALPLSGWTLAVSILLVSGCGYTPNLIPSGAPEILSYPGIRAIAANSEYPIVTTVKRGQGHVNIHWAKKGGLIWGERPGNTAAQWRFVMSRPGVEGEPLCITPWQTDADGSNPDFTEVTCKFTVEDNLATPLVGEVIYRLSGEPTGEEDPYRSERRTFYLVDN